MTETEHDEQLQNVMAVTALMELFFVMARAGCDSPFFVASRAGKERQQTIQASPATKGEATRTTRRGGRLRDIGLGSCYSIGRIRA